MTTVDAMAVLVDDKGEMFGKMQHILVDLDSRTKVLTPQEPVALPSEGRTVSSIAIFLLADRVSVGKATGPDDLVTWQKP